MSVVRVLLATLFVGVTQAHDWGWGICPRVDAVQNLSVDKFMGLWYVIQQFDTSSSCLTLNYTRVSDTQLKVSKARQFYLLDAVGMEHTNSYTGSLDIPDGENQGQMRVKWPLSMVYTNSYSGRLDIPDGDNQGRMRVKWPTNFAGKGDYVVVDTDYTGYAGIYECQRITSLMHRQSATILSRTPFLNVTFIDRVKRRLRSFDIDDHDFDQVAHESCISRADSDLNINVDEDTFKKIVSDTVEGVKNVANTTTHAVQDGYDKVVDGYDKTTDVIYEGYDKSKTALTYGVAQTGLTLSDGLYEVADGVRGVADVVGAGATGILAGQTEGDKEVVVVNVGYDVNVDPDAELI